MCDQVKCCTLCKKTFPISFFHKRKLAKKEGLQSHCKKCHKKYKSTEKAKLGRRRYLNKKYRTNENYRIQKSYRKKTTKALKRLLSGKLQTTKDKHRDYLGCSISYYKDYIESKFQEGMTWENYGVHGWHLDHIIPCTAFDLTNPEQIKKCFHYTNTQPLWAKDNIKKSNTIPV
jgi:hypothetical protein